MRMRKLRIKVKRKRRGKGVIMKRLMMMMMSKMKIKMKMKMKTVCSNTDCNNDINPNTTNITISTTSVILKYFLVSQILTQTLLLKVIFFQKQKIYRLAKKP